MLSEKLESIINECRMSGYRILIEIEPSGKLYFWCDKNYKRFILRMIRRNKIQQNLNWNLTDEKIKYIKDQDLVCLEKNKGKIVSTFKERG